MSTETKQPSAHLTTLVPISGCGSGAVHGSVVRREVHVTRLLGSAPLLLRRVLQGHRRDRRRRLCAAHFACLFGNGTF